MNFESRLLDLSNYNKYLKDVIELLSEKPMKLNQLATVKKLQCMILNKEIVSHDIARCEEILRKMKCLCEKVHEMKMIPIYQKIDEFKPFLVNLIKKYENSEKTPKHIKECKYVKSLFLIVDKRKLNIHNAARCETILKMMIDKIEKNTIAVITSRAEINPVNQVNQVDNDILVDHSRTCVDPKYIIKHTEAKDPRIIRGQLFHKPKMRGMYLKKIENLITISTKEDRLAYKYKSMIKSKSIPELEHYSMSVQNTAIIPSTNGIPQMVPPPNITHNNLPYLNSKLFAGHHMSSTSAVLSNTHMQMIQSQAKVSQNDPRLKSRTGSNTNNTLPPSTQHVSMTNKYSMPAVNNIYIETQKPLLELQTTPTSNYISTSTLQGQTRSVIDKHSCSEASFTRNSLTSEKNMSSLTVKSKFPITISNEIPENIVLKASTIKKNDTSANPEEVLKMLGNVYGEDTVTAFAQFVAMKVGKDEQVMNNDAKSENLQKETKELQRNSELKLLAKSSRSSEVKPVIEGSNPKNLPCIESQKSKTSKNFNYLDTTKTNKSTTKKSSKKRGFLEDESLNEFCEIKASNTGSKKVNATQKSKMKEVSNYQENQSKLNKRRSTSLRIEQSKVVLIEKNNENQSHLQSEKKGETPNNEIKTESIENQSIIVKENEDLNVTPKGKPNAKPIVRKKRGRTELEKLNIDINEMFIRDGVLNATGRRNVPVKTYNEDRYQDCRRQSNLRTSTAEKKISGSITTNNTLKRCVVVLTRLECETNKECLNYLNNINPGIHLQNEYRIKCIICDTNIKKSETITSHYINEHQCNEIYTSRLKPSFANVVLTFPYFKEGILEGSKFSPGTRITSTCKFCMEKMSLIGKNWKIHLMQHTGEFKCKSCNVKHGNPSWNKTFVNKYPHKENCVNRNFITEDIQFDKGVLMAYMCKLCNYVQLQKHNISKHLTKEHNDFEECNIHMFEIVNYKSEDTFEEKEQMPELVPEVIPTPLLSSSSLHTDHTYSTNPIKQQDNVGKTQISKNSTNDRRSQNKECTNKSFSAPLDHINPLKVWVNKPSEKIKQVIMESLSNVNVLYSFYKCMVVECIFATDNKDEAIKHFSSHDSSSFECPYCDHSFASIKDLMEHLKMHETSIYQCAYCFYRSCAAFNVVTHQNHYHSSLDVKILLCKGTHQQIANDMNLINSCREKYVPPLLCTICNKKWFIFNLFEDHLLTHTQKIMKCQACKSDLNRSDLLKHLHTHRIGLFECVYCFYGTNEMDSMRLHMSTIHPTRLLYVVARQCKKGVKMENVDEHSIDSTVLAHIGACVDKSFIHTFSLPAIKVESDSIEYP